MEKDPAKRIQTCEEVAAEAESIRKRRQMLALQAVPLMLKPRKARRLRIPITARLIGAAIIAVAVFLFAGGETKSPTPPPARKKVTTRASAAKPAPAKKSSSRSSGRRKE
jgi:type VI protein secretion system component VasF